MTKIGVKTGLLVALLSACTVGSVGCDGGSGKKDGGTDAKSDAKVDMTPGTDAKADATVDTTPAVDMVVTPDTGTADVTPDTTTTPDAAVDMTPAVDMAADRTPDAAADTTPTTDATVDMTPTTDGAVVTRSIGGTISGLLGTGAVLRNNGGDSLPLTPGATAFPFTFTTRLPVGSTYNVTVQTQPSSPSQTCDVVNGSGTVGASNITNIAITCTTRTFTVTGTIAGYTGTGLVLQNNGAGNVTVAANATTFAFPAQASGSAYAVTVLTQPSSPPQICTVAQGSGTVGGANVTNVAITCATQVFTVGGSISGLTGAGLVLRNNAGDNETVAAGATSFTFDTSLATGSAYAVTILTQPAGQTCTVANGTGTVAMANITTPAITCVTNFSVGGTVAGLTGTGLVLQNNLGDNVTVAANATTFTFPTRLASGPYSVTVLTQPTSPAQTCTVAMGTGTVTTANITNVAVTCSTSYTVGGMLTGLTAGGLVLRNNGGNDLTVPANATTFTFTNPLAPNATYDVTVLTNPTGLVCTVTGGGMGTVTTANVTNVAIGCTPRFTVSGGITGLTTTGLILRINGMAANDVTVPANATTYAFTAPLLAMGDAYAVTVQQQPSGGITCTAAAGGTVGTTAPTVAVTCTNAPAASICFYQTEAAAGGNPAVLTCPGAVSQLITAVTYVSFGDPTGTCPGPFTTGSCNSPTARGIVEGLCVGQHTCTVPVDFAVLGDSCPGTGKALAFIATCN